MAPAAAIRCALSNAICPRQAFQTSGGRPAAALSWLIKVCCSEISGDPAAAGSWGAGAMESAAAAASAAVTLASRRMAEALTTKATDTMAGGPSDFTERSPMPRPGKDAVADCDQPRRTVLQTLTVS